MTYDIYKNLEERISNWGLSNEEILAIYVVGSRARVDKPFDEFSDLDIVVFSTNPEHLFTNVRTWLEQQHLDVFNELTEDRGEPQAM